MKYNIRIEIYSEYDLDNKFQELISENLKQPVGIVVTDLLGNGVLPLLCDFENKRAFILHVSRDENPSSDYVGEDVVKACERVNLKIETIKIKGTWESGASKDTECITFLRNALLHIKDEKWRIPHPHKNVDSLIKWEKNRQIPNEWSYIIDTLDFFKKDPTEENLVIRDLYSSKQEKKDNPRKIVDFQKRHTNEVKFQCTLELKKRKIEDKKELEEVLNYSSADLPKGLQITNTDQFLTIEWIETKNVNTYMVYKGYRNAKDSLKRFNS